MKATTERAIGVIAGLALALGIGGCDGSPSEPYEERFVETPLLGKFKAQLVQTTESSQAPAEVEAACGPGTFRYSTYRGEGRLNGDRMHIEYSSCVDLTTMDDETGILSVVTAIVSDDLGELCADHVTVMAQPSGALDGMILWSADLLDPVNIKAGRYADLVVDVIWKGAEAASDGVAWIRLEGSMTEERRGLQ